MPQSQAHMKATNRFNSKAYEAITIRLRKDKTDNSGLSREIIQNAADAAGLSLNAFCLAAIKEKIEKS